MAAMVWPPTASENVENVAVPPDTAPLPSVAAPSLKVTLPPGVPEAGDVAVTVAVKVTDCPNALGVADEPSEVLVPPWFTVCDRLDEVEVVKFTSPA